MLKGNRETGRAGGDWSERSKSRRRMIMGEDRQADIKQPKSPINKEIMNIAWPVLIELVLSSLFGMINMMMLGNIADHGYAAAAVAAVGVTNQPLFLGLAVVQALNIGGTALIARYFGAGNHDRMENVMKHVMIISMILSAPLALAAFIYADQIMAFMGAQQDTIEVGRIYFRIICISYLLQSFNFSISGSLRGIGETQIPMGVNLQANFLNVIGNALLIYGLFGVPALGIQGAAISTVIANTVACSLLIRYLRSGKSKLNFSFAHPFHFSMKTMKSLAKIGLPSALEQLALRSGMILFIQIVSGLGTVVFAAHNIGMNILTLSFTLGQAFGIAASSLVGRALGAGDANLAEKYASRTGKIGSICGAILGLAFFFGAEYIVSFYSSDPEIIRNAAIAIRVAAITQPFQSHQLIVAGSLRGAGDTIFPLISTFFGILIIRVAAATFFVQVLGLGLLGAWLAVMLDQIIRWFLIAMRFRSGKWKRMKLA